MLVGLYRLDYPYFQKKINQRYKQVLDFNKVPYIELDLNDKDFWDKINKLDYFIFRWAQPDHHQQIAKTILPIIENHYNVKCFPDQNTCWHYDDKIKEYYLFNFKNYPFIKSWIFWNLDSALEFVNNTDYPLVFKLKGGAGSSNVILLRNKIEAEKIVRHMFLNGSGAKGLPHKNNLKYRNLLKLLKKHAHNFLYSKKNKLEQEHWQVSKNYVLFQEFLPNNKFDTRVITTDNITFAARRFVRKNDFRASGSGLIDFDHNNVDLRMLEIANKISKEMKFQTMAYDFLLDGQNKPKICEVSYNYADAAMTDQEGYWDSNLVWIKGKYLPEFLHIKNLTRIDDLKQPNIF